VSRSQITHEQYLRTKYFGALDGLRCLSILMVIGFHCQLTVTRFFKTGHYGVSLFFAISGFLITTLLLRGQSSTSGIALRQFYVRRTLRIFPLYYASLLVYTALVNAFEHGPERDAFWRNWPFFFTYTSNLFVDRDIAPRVIFAFAWSLAAEEQFYLCWPSIVRYAKRWWIPVAVMIGAIAFDAFFEAGTYLGWIDFGAAGNRIVTSVATPICLGCLLAYSLHNPRSFAVVRPILAFGLAAPIAILAMAIAWYFRVIWAMNLFMTLLVGAACIRSDNSLAWLLANPVARYIGMVSYGLYLLHTLAIHAAKLIHPDRDWLFFPLALAISLAVASASYWMFELPFLRLKNRFRKAEQSTAENQPFPDPSAASRVSFDPIRV
jgi:peptidoglycan/LPS O-acetylase OafA/YrhL